MRVLTVKLLLACVVLLLARRVAAQHPAQTSARESLGLAHYEPVGSWADELARRQPGAKSITYRVLGTLAPDEADLVDRAMALVGERILDERISESAERLIAEYGGPDAYQVRSRVQQKLGVFRNEVLGTQLAALRRAHKMPLLVLRAVSMNDRTPAQGELETLEVTAGGSTRGCFDVSLNVNRLGARDSQNPDEWAGWIAHEMLQPGTHAPGCDPGRPV